MKTIIATLFAALALTSFGESSWAAVYTKEYGGDKDPSVAHASLYSSYYCTEAAAQRMFSGTTVDAINDYLVKNFADGKQAMSEDEESWALNGIGYDLGQYEFKYYFETPISSENPYLAVVFYDNSAFRVFGSDSALFAAENHLVFDDQTAAAGTVGDWMTVPEPTSGMLFLLGSALLALRRKRG